MKLSGKSIVGASFTELTVKLNISESSKSPSLTVTDIITDPNQLGAGVSISEESAISAVTLSLSLSAVKLKVSPSASLAEIGIANGTSSNVDVSAIATNTGA